MINASSAYARGATGRGTIIGIMDSGVDTSHQELDGDNKLLSESYLVYQSRSPSTDEKRHGSHVAGIALRHLAQQQQVLTIQIFLYQDRST